MKRKPTSSAVRSNRRKKKKRAALLRIMLIIELFLAAAVFCIAGYKLFSALHNYNESKDSYDNIRSLFYDDTIAPKNRPTGQNSASTDETDEAEPIESFVWDYSKLLEINPDGIGYIRMRGEGSDIIDYPIVQGSDNSYYLTHLFDGSSNPAGAIFMDCDAYQGFDSRYSIIYGHNMKSGSRMFSCLKNYKDPDYFATHSEVDIYAGEKHYVYKVFAQFQTTTNSFIYADIYPDDDTFMYIISEALNSSAIDAGIPLDYFSPDSHVITLSTCTDRYDEYLRYVVLLVRDREITDQSEQ